MVSELCKKLDPVVDGFRTRPLTSEYLFLIVDAIYIKVRENNRVRSKSLLIVIGVNEEGNREIIGFHLSESESETSWEEFFISLKQRGLKSPRLITSDNHKGLVKAIQKQFQGSSWQRCQTHFSRNILDKTPKSIQPSLKEDLRKVYKAVDIDSARAANNELLNKYAESAPKAMELLDEGFDDVTAVLSLPLRYRKRLRTTYGIERLKQEIRRRERVIRIFPNEASAIRLIGALLIEKMRSGQQAVNTSKWMSITTQ